MAEFKVTPEMLRTAAQKVESEADNFESAAKAAKGSADQLIAQWEGDAQKVFASEQQRAHTWYLQMSTLARQYAVALRKAANEYEQADRSAASTIGAN